MIFGMTNAGAGGGLKLVTGSFTSSNTETQEKFTVSGLTFEPKIVAIRRTSLTDGDAVGGNNMLICAFSDLETNIGFCGYGISGSGTVKTSSALTVSGCNGTYTVTSSTYPFSYVAFGKANYGKYTYYIYG
ncbi:MAG: hypothetical protein E7330_01255 [Clostridiales bacterium]|nr:hypothetical protein [Clostridiales bacterium]